jgi:hypothetical protein
MTISYRNVSVLLLCRTSVLRVHARSRIVVFPVPRDKVLETAIREIVGKDVPAAQIEKMAKH